MKIIEIDDIFVNQNISKDEFNKQVIQKISKHPGWHLSDDEDVESKKLDGHFCDTGMLLQSYFMDNKNPNKYHGSINLLAQVVLNSVIDCCPLKFEEITPIRFLWNYYNRSSTGILHRDISENKSGNYCSVVYYLNDCDGFTIIGDNKYQSKSGKCILFDSKLEHRGTGPVISSKRYCLNIMFKYN